MCSVPQAHALDPNKTINEYFHDRWDARQGFPGGPVHAITQTPDGYLWLGTEKGLLRFDGLNFQLFNQANSQLPAGPVMELMTDGEGILWIRPQSANLFYYVNGKFQDVINDVSPARSAITAMCRTANGQGLFSVYLGGVETYRGGKFSEVIPSPRAALVISLAQTNDGTIWMGTRDVGLLYMKDKELRTIAKELPDTKVNSLLAIDSDLWIGTDHGLVHWNGREIVKSGVPALPGNTQVLSLTKDTDSNIWIGTSEGLLRLNKDGVTSLADSGSPLTGSVNVTFEDRERNLWVGSSRGIERLRDSSFMTYSASRDSSAQASGTVYVDTQGRRWFAPSDGGLHWEKGQQMGYVKNDGLDSDVVYSLTGSKNELWIGRQRGGLTHLSYGNGSVTTKTYTQADGLIQNSVTAVYQSRDGTVWAGSLSAGVTRFKAGTFTAYTTANGLASNTIISILEGADGTMWFATANGLSSLTQNSWKTYGGVNGLPPGRINCLFEDTNGMLWIGTDDGIAIIRSGQVQIPLDVPAALHEPVLGMAGDGTGFLWLSTSNHVLRVYRDKLLNGNVSEGDVREFGLADGLRSVEGVRRDRSVTTDPLGRIWFSTSLGLSVVDPKQVADNSVPAIVHIEQVARDGSPIGLNGPIRIAGGRQRITFSFTGLSLSVPERVRFRYKLEDYDKNWSDPGAAREAVYTNLDPGTYHFRVMASNSAGLWNGEESTVQLEIEPLFWQTWWFRLSSIMAIGLAILFFYRLRLHQLTQQMNVRFEERLAERTRIAQDLHDTLLQGFLSAAMQLHVADKKLPAESPAKPLVSRVLALMDQVIDEGRTTLQGLRSATSDSYDLAQSFSGIKEELCSEEQTDYRVTVEGSSRPLHPFIRDEIYHIGREALLNAFRHSQANIVEVELEYRLKQFRILVRDDGLGIDPQVLRSGREGHWGLPG
ncbi:MAG TPA: two-component regulator propeller domain-containing protein, partial [Pyrinomonadaceae bacterium]|nr:two-component regulator propeller domain-containing protein [Pyrinomonadaceae bacterium]